MATAEHPRLLTAEAFERIPDAFKRYELDAGLLVDRETGQTVDPDRACEQEPSPMGNLESLIAMRIALHLGRHLNDAETVEILGPDARFRLPGQPPTIRGCDVAYVPRARMPLGRPTSEVGDYIPALVVEVVSPGNSANSMSRKVREWLGAGATIVWIIYPEEKCVYVHRDLKGCSILGAGETLEGEPVLPGLRIPVEMIFP